MEQITLMVTFARVVQAGSFAGGARRLGVTTSVASKHVAKLEKALGARLLNRSTRALSLTEAGAAYVQHCLQVADEIEAAERTVGGLQATPAGLLRVSAPPTFSLHHVVPHLGEFHRRHPQVRIELDLSNRIVDLVEDGFDLALRAMRTPAPSLVARKLVHLRSVVCAAPAYLERRGTPQQPEDLCDHDCLLFTLPSTLASWSFRRDGIDSSVALAGPFAANSMEPLRQLALEGHGMLQAPTYLVGDDLRAGRLVRVLPEHESLSETDVHAVYLPQPWLPPKLAAFVEFFAERFGGTPYWDRGLFDAAPQPLRRGARVAA